MKMPVKIIDFRRSQERETNLPASQKKGKTAFMYRDLSFRLWSPIRGNTHSNHCDFYFCHFQGRN